MVFAIADLRMCFTCTENHISFVVKEKNVSRDLEKVAETPHKGNKKHESLTKFIHQLESLDSGSRKSRLFDLVTPLHHKVRMRFPGCSASSSEPTG